MKYEDRVEAMGCPLLEKMNMEKDVHGVWTIFTRTTIQVPFQLIIVYFTVMTVREIYTIGIMLFRFRKKLNTTYRRLGFHREK